MSGNILQTRITAPNFPSNTIHRKRLVQLLSSNKDKSLILVAATAGYGKTTLVVDFLSRQKNKFAWLYIGSDLNSYDSFFLYLIHSLARFEASFGEKTLSLISSLKAGGQISKTRFARINDIAAIFINEFCNTFKEEIFLVIDDLHNIESTDANQWLNYTFDYLFENLPPNLHIIITTRVVPGFNIAKLKAKRRAFVIETPGLILDNSEVSEIIDEVYSMSFSGNELTALNKYINGWVTGLHLIMQAYGKNFKNLNLDDKDLKLNLFDYFAEEIFKSLDKDVQNFLLNTSLLDSFDYELCDFALSITNSKEIINVILKKNIFIHGIPDLKNPSRERKVFHYHDLFKLFLQSKLSEISGENDTNNFLNRLSEFYFNDRDYINAVTFGLKAKNYEKTVPIIENHYQELLEKGNYEVLWNWFSVIPPEIIKRNSKLLYALSATHLYYNSDPKECIKNIREAISIAEKTGKDEFFINCYLLKADALFLLSEKDLIVKDLNFILKLAQTPKEKAKTLYYLARAYFQIGFSEFNKSINLLTEALEICNEIKMDDLKPAVLRYMGHIYGDWGEIVKSIYYYEQAVNFNTGIYPHFTSIINLVGRYCYTGNYVKAKELLNEAWEIFHSYPAGLFRRFLIKSTASFCFEFGDYEESINKYREVTEIELKNQVRTFAATNYFIIGECFNFLGKYSLAEQNFLLAQDYFEKDDEYMNLLYLFLISKLESRAVVNETIENSYLKFLKYLDENKLFQSTVQVQFHLADFYLKSNMTDTARKYLSLCLDTSSDKQYISYLENEVFPSRRVFDFAIENNIQKQFVKTIIENVRNKNTYSWISGECKKRLEVQAESLTDLGLYTFGKTEIWLRGEKVPEEKWTRKKSKIILAYLLVKPDYILNKNKIIDIFFQDIPIDTVDTVYHNTLSNIRSAVKIDPLKNFPAVEQSGKKKSKFEIAPQFLIYEDKNLSLNKDYFYKSDNIEFEKLYNSAMASGTNISKKIDLCKKAAGIYKGEFMPGYYDAWCEQMRQNYSNMYQKICEDLIEIFSDKENYEDVIIYSTKLLETDKLHSEAYIKLIQSHVQTGRVNIARDIFALMLKNYDQELGEKPELKVLNRINEIFWQY